MGKVKVTQFLKIAMLTKDMKIINLARKTGRSQPNVSNILGKDTCTVKTLIDFVEAMGETLKIKFDGKEYEIEN